MSAVRNQSVVWFVFLPVAPVTTAGPAIPALAGVTIALGLLSVLLLGHLLCFHIYLSEYTLLPARFLKMFLSAELYLFVTLFVQYKLFCEIVLM